MNRIEYYIIQLIFTRRWRVDKKPFLLQQEGPDFKTLTYKISI